MSKKSISIKTVFSLPYFEPDKKETVGVKTTLSKRHRTEVHTAQLDHKKMVLLSEVELNQGLHLSAF